MAKTEKRIDYISKVEDIRLIASGVNAEHRTMTWREATEYWERDNGTDDYGRAALMASAAWMRTASTVEGSTSA